MRTNCVAQGMLFHICCDLNGKEIQKLGDIHTHIYRTSQVTLKNPPANAGDIRDTVSMPWVGKIPWRRKWRPTSVFLPGKAHGQRSLVGCSPAGCKESDMTEATQHAHTHITDSPCYTAETEHCKSATLQLKRKISH